MKFAKLYDIADTQVLIEAKADSSGEAAIHFTTTIKGQTVCIVYTMLGETQQDAWALAFKNLEGSGEDVAEEAYARAKEHFEATSANDGQACS